MYVFIVSDIEGYFIFLTPNVFMPWENGGHLTLLVIVLIPRS